MHRDLKLANILIHFPDEDFSFKEISASDQVQRIQRVSKRLKAMNLLESKVQIKIADLGFARELGHEDLTETICGTPLVMAPEVLNGVKYNHKADVWSMGIVFFELITGFTPFTGRDREDLKRNLEKGAYKLPKRLKLSLQGLDFLNCCLQYDQIKRMAWSELIKHPYIIGDPKEETEED
jgi:serine/threonine-protein kinase ULK/ATG1